MAVNQSHTESRRGALIPSGESVLKQCEDVDLCFLQKPAESSLFNGTKKGTLFLTSYRVVFVTSHLVNDPMLSFMMPFGLMGDCTIEQPIFAPNYIKGTIQAAPGGNCCISVLKELKSPYFAKFVFSAARGIPLGSVNYWFDTSGLYIVTVPGGAVCSPQTPCPAYPIVNYGPPPPGYGAQRGEYGTLPEGYGAQPGGYGAPPMGYGAPPVGYGAPPVGYGAPPGGYGAPPGGYGAPPEGYGAPPAGYGAPPGGYGAPPAGYGAPPAGYGAPPAGNEALPPAYEAPSAGNTAASHRSVAAQQETSLPSTSSSQVHLPPSQS
uniref:WBP2 N-terminal like n=1 Tax=Moschus moschiferus TaxID=68415 RepID=A0A8C6G243_MOSMO